MQELVLSTSDPSKPQSTFPPPLRRSFPTSSTTFPTDLRFTDIFFQQRTLAILRATSLSLSLSRTITMGLFSKKKAAEKPKSTDGPNGKAPESEPPQKYMHVPSHAYRDALNSIAGAYDSENRILVRQAAERRKTRINSQSTFTSNDQIQFQSPNDSQVSLSNWQKRQMIAQQSLSQSHGSFSSTSTRSDYKYHASPLSSMFHTYVCCDSGMQLTYSLVSTPIGYSTAESSTSRM